MSISCGGGVVGDLCGLLSFLYFRGTIYFHINHYDGYS